MIALSTCGYTYVPRNCGRADIKKRLAKGLALNVGARNIPPKEPLRFRRVPAAARDLLVKYRLQYGGGGSGARV